MQLTACHAKYFAYELIRRFRLDAQDEVDRQRDSLIADIEGRRQQRATPTNLFSVRWGLR